MHIDLWVLAFASLHVGLLVAGWLVRKQHPVVTFSVFWFYLTLAPTSSIVPILDVIFEHRMYIPMIGMSLSFPFAVDFLCKAFQKGWSRCGNYYLRSA